MQPFVVILIFTVAGLGCWLLSGLIEWLLSGRASEDTDPETLDD